MMNNIYSIQKMPLLVFRGKQTLAEYHEEISLYQGNPLIEALPKILDEDSVIEQLQDYPVLDESERQLPAHLRLHLIQNVFELFIVLSHHLDLEQRFSRMIRAGYRARNPVQRDFWQSNQEKVELLRTGQKLSFSSCKRSTATGFTILGISGVGKTTAIESILNLYPQVIFHNSYKQYNLTLTQLVWLKLECPADGSVKGLCINFFQAVDDIFGTNYYYIYASNGKKTVNEMMPNMALVAANINLGVLVIDEIQSLTKLNIGGYEKILDFFVELINTIGLPVVLVGTYKAWSILGNQFRQIRRGTGQGDFIWERMKEDEDWQLFVEGLWKYQYLKHDCKLNSKFSHALYYECQGITDFAIKIFMLAQARAITTGTEKLTVGLIKSVAKDCLRTARDILDALKINDLQKLQNCEDVYLNINSFLEEETRMLNINQDSLINEELISSELPENNPVKPDPSSKSNKSSNSSIQTNKKTKIVNQLNPRLLEIADDGQKNKLSIYQSLKKANYICSATEYL